MSLNWNLGVDAGATKTEAAIQLENGLIFSSTGPPSNLHNMKLDQAAANIILTIDAVKQKIKDHQIDNQAQVACIGWSGLDTEEDRQRLINIFSSNTTVLGKNLIIVNDAYVALRSVKRVKYGLCLIAGTGTQCYGITPDGNEAKAGHWGYLLGGQASGFALGASILKQVMKEHDGRSRKTELSQAVTKHFQIQSADELPGIIYTSNSVSQIASTTKILDNKSVSSLPFIQTQIEKTTNQMLLSIEAVMRKLVYVRIQNIPLVVVGGLFNHRPLFFNPLKQLIAEKYPQIQVIRPQNKPVTGALHISNIYQKESSRLPVNALIFPNTIIH